jgi:hypothetical protein
MAIPVLEPLELAGKTLTADALLTQRQLAAYPALCSKRTYLTNQPVSGRLAF